MPNQKNRHRSSDSAYLRRVDMTESINRLGHKFSFALLQMAMQLAPHSRTLRVHQLWSRQLVFLSSSSSSSSSAQIFATKNIFQIRAISDAHSTECVIESCTYYMLVHPAFTFLLFGWKCSPPPHRSPEI
jgi:hypothetical protein